MSKSIEVTRLSYSYPDGLSALRDVSFSIEDGECVGLIGPNGAGKTTLLLHLNGILKGGKGEVSIYGRRVMDENLSWIRKEVGLVFQDPNTQLFMPTVFEDVAFGPMQMGLERTEVLKRVKSALARVDMQGFEDRVSHHLSFGEKKRASVATVLSMEPRLVVLDEPTSNLDPKHREQLIRIVKSIKGTKLIASHDLEMISRLADRVIVLNEGRIAAMDETSRVFADKGFLRHFGLCREFPSLTLPATT